ncbi:unnamed protein product, partial [Nesidiocoris tenuis]
MEGRRRETSRSRAEHEKAGENWRRRRGSCDDSYRRRGEVDLFVFWRMKKKFRDTSKTLLFR